MMNEIPRLGVNIDHVATLRQARGECYPSVVEAANLALLSGADQITIHLREDRRHIQDTDVEAIHLVTKRFGKPLNLEMGINEEIIDIAIASQPEWVCIVPELRQEKTTEGGLDLINQDHFRRVDYAIRKLRKGVPQLKISLFLESDLHTLMRARDLNVDAVEIHTGEYARIFNDNNPVEKYLNDFKAARDFLVSHNMGCHAGHGLTLESVKTLLKNHLFAEYNIGHFIVSEAIFKGMGPVISDFIKCFEKLGNE